MNDLNISIEELENKLRDIESQLEKKRRFAKYSQNLFKKNCAALKKYFPELATRVESHVPRSDFNVFPTASGHGNYVPKGSSVPIYGDNPIEQTREQVKRYTESATFGRCNLYKEADEGTKFDKRLHVRYMVELAESFREVVTRDAPLLDNLPPHFPTCIMFGVGLGYALSELLERHTFDYLFLCEPDFDTFYASLFCTDWEKIFSKADVESGCVFLHIGVTYETFFQEIQKICENIGAFSLISSFCYQHTPGAEVNALIKEFFDKFYQLQLGYGFYNDAVTGLAHTIENVNENKTPLFIAPEKQKSPYKNYTAYVVANGPSLDEAIDVLKENQRNVIIFAAGTAINTLLNIGVVPDFHVLVERPKVTYDVLKDTLTNDQTKNLNLLAVDVMYPEVPGLYKWAGLGLKGPEAGSLFTQYEYYKKHRKILGSLPHCSPLVANTALSFASMMGFGEIYLLGVDNGYPLSGPSHSKHSIYSDSKFKKEYQVSTDVPYRLNGNFGGDVKATGLMVQAKQQMEYLISKMPHIQYYNVGDGAKLLKAQPLKADDILCMQLKEDKKNIVEDIKANLFSQQRFHNLDKLVGVKEFESLCEHLIVIARRPYTCRKEASDILKAQARVVFAYRGKKYGHLFHVLKGTMLYFHGPLITLLYRYQDEKKTLLWFKKSLAVWVRCIIAMKSDYQFSWNKRCEHSLFIANEKRRLSGLL